MRKAKSRPAGRARRPRTKSRTAADEIVGIVLLALAAFMLIALVSFDARDPSLFSARAAGVHVHNYGGKTGAGLADLLLQVFGLPAYLLAVLTGALGLRAVLAGEDKRLGRKAAMFAVPLLILCPLLVLLFQRVAFRGTEIQVGGLLGDLLNSGLNGLFSTTGTLIVLLAAGALYIIIATGFSFKKLFLAVSRMFSFAFQEVRIKIAERPKPARAPTSRAVEKKPAPPAEEPEKEKTFGEGAPPPAVPDETKRDRRERKRIEREKSKELVSKPVKPVQPELPKPEQFVLPEFDTLSGYHIPPLTLLDPGKPVEKIDKNELFEKKTRIEEKLREFRVEGEVKEYHPGPIITTYEFYPNPGIKISQVANLSEDVSLALGAESVRIQRIPGKSSLGVEIPNNKREVIKLRDIIASESFTRSPSKLTFALGKTVHDEVYVTDLDVMPHLLIAGATGTGKSVCLNALIASIMYKASPQEVKLLLIDPKRLEFTLYDGIPHLLSPVINDPKKAGVVLMDAVKKMERRYHLLSQHKVRNIEQFNHYVAQTLQEKKGRLTEDERTTLRPLPYIVIIIDELAELMMVGAQDVDYAIARLAQLARAVGIHLVLATQRPSIDVITGTIKNNFSCRIAFRVPSKVDSRVILDTVGAEKLLGMGDMLFMPPNQARPVRLHCAYVSIPEIRRLVKFVREQGAPEYDERILNVIKSTGTYEWDDLGEKDENYDKAVELILHTGQASASYLQRKLKLGYARASRIIDQMEQEGILGPSEGSKPREILIDVKQWVDQSRKKKTGGGL